MILQLKTEQWEALAASSEVLTRAIQEASNRPVVVIDYGKEKRMDLDPRYAYDIRAGLREIGFTPLSMIGVLDFKAFGMAIIYETRNKRYTIYTPGTSRVVARGIRTYRFACEIAHHVKGDTYVDELLVR